MSEFQSIKKPEVCKDLFEQIKPPKISENLSKDPAIAKILKAPEKTNEAQ